MRAVPQAGIAFNYLGQFDQLAAMGGSADGAFGIAPEQRGPERDPGSLRYHLLEVNGGIMGGRLQMAWAYSANLHRRETVERVANGFVEALRRIIRHAQESDTPAFTASDFADFGWDAGDFAEILAELKDGMKEMADDLAEVRSDFAEMRSDFAEMRSDFAEMQDDFDEFLADMEEDF